MDPRYLSQLEASLLQSSMALVRNFAMPRPRQMGLGLRDPTTSLSFRRRVRALVASPIIKPYALGASGPSCFSSCNP